MRLSVRWIAAVPCSTASFSGRRRRGGRDARRAVGGSAQAGQQGVGPHGHQAQVGGGVHRAVTAAVRAVDHQVAGRVGQRLQVGDHRDAHDLGQGGAQAAAVGVDHGDDAGVPAGGQLRQQGQLGLPGQASTQTIGCYPPSRSKGWAAGQAA